MWTIQSVGGFSKMSLLSQFFPSGGGTSSTSTIKTNMLLVGGGSGGLPAGGAACPAIACYNHAAGGGGGGGYPGWSRAFPGNPGIAGNTYGAGGQGQGTPSSVGSSGYAGIVLLRAPVALSYTAPGASVFSSPTHRVFVYTGTGAITFS